MSKSINNPSGFGLYSAWIGLLSVLVIMGGYVALLTFTQGLSIMKVSFQIPWTLSIAVYVFLAVTSTGLCIISSFGNLGISYGSVIGFKHWEVAGEGRVGRTCVLLAILTLLAAFIVIGLHLGRVDRMPSQLTLSPNLHSAMWWMGTLYGLYLIFICCEFWYLIRRDTAAKALQVEGGLKKFYRLLTLGNHETSEESYHRDHKRARLFGTLALIAGVSAHATLGALFAHLDAKVLWYGAFYPVFFILSAVFSGIAWLSLITYFTFKLEGRTMGERMEGIFIALGRIMAFLLAVCLLFIGFKMASALGSPEKLQAAALLLNGPFSTNFWLFEITIGLLIPIILLTMPGLRDRLGTLAIASVCVIIGVFVMRFDMVTAGQVFPAGVFLDSYMPLLPEIILTIGVFALVLLAYTLAAKYLPLQETLRVKRS